MKLSFKHLKVFTGENIATLHFIDARSLGIKEGDRIEIVYKKKKLTAVIDVTYDAKFVPRNHLGISKEIQTYFKSKNTSSCTVNALGTPESLESIKRKIHGERLSKKEIFQIIRDIVDDKLTDIEKSFFVSGCYNHELSLDETIHLTNAMIHTGNVLHFGSTVADKHCIGGVAGNRTTCFVAPIIAAAGYTIPKTSSRSITSPAGTADTMEVLCDVTLSFQRIKEVVSKTKACMVWGGGIDFVPSDSKIIRIEHSVSLTPIGQMIASVLAKKKAAGSTHCLIDIPVGKGSKVETRKYARFLRKRFESVGKAIGLKVKVMFTDGSEPVGNGIGPALEARDLLWTLSGHALGSRQLRQKGIKLAGDLLKLLGEKHPHAKAQELVDDGSAIKKFNEILIAQGLIQNNPSKVKVGKYSIEVKAKNSGKIRHIDNKIISEIAKLAGAPLDKSAGLYLNFHKGRKIEKGDCLFKIYSNSKQKLDEALKFAHIDYGFKIR